jgi:hypothetical protein
LSAEILVFWFFKLWFDSISFLTMLQIRNAPEDARQRRDLYHHTKGLPAVRKVRAAACGQQEVYTDTRYKRAPAMDLYLNMSS